MYLATRRNAKKDAPIRIVCQFHCNVCNVKDQNLQMKKEKKKKLDIAV